MRNSRQIYVNSIRRFLWRAMLLMMFLYVCADVSIFEYFEGNQSLGIISYREVVKLDQPVTGAGTSLAKTLPGLVQFAPHNERTTTLFDDTDDFCCSVHAMVSGNKVIVSFIPIFNRIGEANFLHRNKDSDWHLPPDYRPPRLA